MKGNPFADATAVQNANLHFLKLGKLIPCEQGQTDVFLADVQCAFRDFVMAAEFPCVGAKAAFNADSCGFAIYSELGSESVTAGLCRDLYHFVQSGILQNNSYATFVAVFRTPLDLDEAEFEERLWKQLREIHRSDAAFFDWSSAASPDPTDPHFSFSFAGQAFYVVGLHGNSSRIARRFPWPTLVFNPHEQFERLRADGKWRRMQETIRTREVALQGTINPMLSDFGEESEARQYSGRAVEDDWRPPFPAGKCPFAH